MGIVVDVDGGEFYWTQKGATKAGQGRLFRANLEIPQGQTATTRQDVELLYDALPEPIDLDIDPGTRNLYWTDRGDPPRGNTVSLCTAGCASRQTARYPKSCSAT